MSRIPGIAPATMSMIPDDRSRLENRFIPWSFEVFEQGVVRGDGPGVDDPGRDHRHLVGRAVEVGGPGRVQHLAGVAEAPGTAEGRGDPGPALQLDHEDGQAGTGGQVGQRSHHGGLADPPLPGHDHDPALAAEGADVHDVTSVVSALAGPAPPLVRADFAASHPRNATLGAKAVEIVVEPRFTSCVARG